MDKPEKKIRIADRSLLRTKNYCIKLTPTEWGLLQQLAIAHKRKLSPMIRDHILTLLITGTIGEPEPC